MSRIAYASRMTPARPGGRAVALAVLMVLVLAAGLFTVALESRRRRLFSW